MNSEKRQKPYIDLNTQSITKAKNDFENDFQKVKGNAVFGKTIYNRRKHRDIKVVTRKK